MSLLYFLSNNVNNDGVSNPPETDVPAGSASVSIQSDISLIPNNPAQTERWYGRPVLKDIGDDIWCMVYANSEAHNVLTSSQLHVRFSDDYGETWSDENKYIDGSSVTGFPMYPPGAVPGETDEGPGEPWLYVCPNGDLLVHMWKVQYATTKNGSYQSRSTDGGKTWSTPALIDFTGTTRDLYIYSTDDDFVLGNTIYAGAREYLNIVQTDGIKSIFIKSDDNGVTWDYVSDITDFSTRPTNEVGLEYIGNNKIVAICRGTNSVADGGPYKVSYLVTSDDLGVTWNTPTTPANIQVNGRIRIKSRSHVKGKNNWWFDPVLIAHGFDQQDIPNGSQRRICVYISKDFGDTWSTAKYLRITGYDGGYGDFLYNPNTDEYVSLQYYAPTSLLDGEIRQINWKLNWI